MDQLNLYFAGNPARPVDEEFDLMVESWTLTLQDAVPEYRLPEVFIHVRRNRVNTFVLDVSEICGAWQQMKAAERALRPTQKPTYATEVCKDCNGTGTKLVKRMDRELGREYVYGEACNHQ